MRKSIGNGAFFVFGEIGDEVWIVIESCCGRLVWE